MNIHASTCWKAIWATLFLALALRAWADPLPQGPKLERSCTGIVLSVNTNEHVVRVKRPFWPAKQFAYGDKCEITLLYAMSKNGIGTSGDLRPGQKVTVSFQESHGALIANQIEQQPMQYVGTVSRINLEKHRLALRRWIFDKRLNIAADCITILGDHGVGTLADIRPGDPVVVLYETPGGNPTAWQITKTAPPAR
jgi:hypothetical protein